NQIRINRQRDQAPEYRDVRALVLKKSRQLLRNVDEQQRARLAAAASTAAFLTGAANRTGLPGDSIHFTVTLPMFLDFVKYSANNWVPCWFNSLYADKSAT